MLHQQSQDVFRTKIQQATRERQDLAEQQLWFAKASGEGKKVDFDDLEQKLKYYESYQMSFTL